MVAHQSKVRMRGSARSDETGSGACSSPSDENGVPGHAPGAAGAALPIGIGACAAHADSATGLGDHAASGERPDEAGELDRKSAVSGQSVSVLVDLGE